MSPFASPLPQTVVGWLQGRDETMLQRLDTCAPVWANEVSASVPSTSRPEGVDIATDLAADMTGAAFGGIQPDHVHLSPICGLNTAVRS